jgi:alkanesulfonate monooxygenase SsuD/methylene tetrahydromethanopterin reductase-like flavin-dependent oxidoreductase (luciferase family)
MQIGISHPGIVPGVQGQLILEWARRADSGPFSSLGSRDRLVDSNYDPLITLAAAAAVTHRIRLMTTVLVVPLHNAGVLAKQAASLDALSNGRLTLGVGMGVREDDFRAAPASFRDRGKRFEKQLDTMKRIWSGQALAEDIGPVGPSPVQPGGPELLIGGYSLAALHRIGRWGDGFIADGGGLEMARQSYPLAQASWQAAGKAGRPRFVATMFFGLGPNAAERAGAYIRHYFAYAPPQAEQIAQSLPTTPEAVKGAMQAFADLGVDELMCWPCIPDLAQVDRLAELLD